MRLIQNDGKRKTGNEYTTDVVPVLNVLSTGSTEEVDGKFKYSVVDTKNDLEFNLCQHFKCCTNGGRRNRLSQS